MLFCGIDLTVLAVDMSFPVIQIVGIVGILCCLYFKISKIKKSVTSV